MVRRIPSAAAVLCLLLVLALPSHAAQTTVFAQFLLNGRDADFAEQSLSVQLYTQEPAGTYSPQESFSFTSHVNRITTDGIVYILPEAEKVWVTADYLTDLNGDGIYEMLSGEDAALQDFLLPNKSLSPTSAQPVYLTQGKTCSLAAKTLSRRGESVWAARGSQISNCTADALSGPESMLYMLQIHWVDPSNEETQSLCYYLKILEELPNLSAASFRDVKPGSWYYASVDYVASNGLMSGTDSTTFSPASILSRAMLAQILYAISGSPSAPDSSFSDAASGDWFYNAVSWASDNGLMNGVGGGRFSPNQNLTRQQLALILFQYANMERASTEERANLEGYSDQASVAAWGREALEWAVAEGLISSRGNNMLAPNESVTRAECACVLRAFLETVI